MYLVLEHYESVYLLFVMDETISEFSLKVILT